MRDWMQNEGAHDNLTAAWRALRDGDAARGSRFAREAAGLRARIDAMWAGEHINYNQYCLRAERRDELRKWLGERDIGTEIYDPLSLHMQECFAYLAHQPQDFPESLRA